MYTEKSDKMFTFLRGVCSDGKHPNTSKALGFAREKHAGQTRKSGEIPYIIHPLSLACDAVGLGLTDDVMLAMLILHDVPEDTGTQVMDLPVDDEVRQAVENMTLRRMPGETKLESKKRYYGNLLKSPYSILGKGLDRRDNLGTMAADLPATSHVKNVYESYYFLLPRLKEAKGRWPEYSSQLHTIRKDILALTNTLAWFNKIELSSMMPSDDELNKIFV